MVTWSHLLTEVIMTSNNEQGIEGKRISNDVATRYTLNHFSELWRREGGALASGEGRRKLSREGEGDEMFE